MPSSKESGGIFDLEEQFTFYASYHNNLSNQIIHILFVWPILWTSLILLWATPLLIKPSSLPSYLPTEYITINGAFIASVLYIIFYLGLEIKNFRKMTGIGLLAAISVALAYVTAGQVHHLGQVQIIKGHPAIGVEKLTIGLHVGSWIMQFVGHGVFEGRRPALLDNLFQAFFMAPIFVIMEVFFLFGFKKNLHKRIQAKVNKSIAAWKVQKEIIQANGGGRVTRSKNKKVT